MKRSFTNFLKFLSVVLIISSLLCLIANNTEGALINFIFGIILSILCKN